MTRSTSTDQAAPVPGAVPSILCRRCGREVTALSSEDLAQAMLTHSRSHALDSTAGSAGPQHLHRPVTARSSD